LGVLRAGDRRGATPATRTALEFLSRRLAAHGARRDPRRAVLRLSGRRAFADRALALARYSRAAGLGVLVTGLDAAEPALIREVLSDPRIDLSAAARSDVAWGRVDERLLVLMRYLAESHGQVTVSCLVTGHRRYSRPKEKVVSMHVYGRAADITSLGGRPISGNSEPGGVAEAGVRSILELPAELQPLQVISLVELGGPSRRLGDHADHIHVGF
jgi:hypothetical protein